MKAIPLAAAALAVGLALGAALGSTLARQKAQGKDDAVLQALDLAMAGVSTDPRGGRSPRPESEEEAVTLARDVAAGGYALLTTKELRQRLSGPEPPLVVDARPAAGEFEEGALPGAVNFTFPNTDMQAWDVDAMGGRGEEDFRSLLGPDPQRPVVFYCKKLRCRSSHQAASWAVKNGYGQVYRYAGGWVAWMQGG